MTGDLEIFTVGDTRIANVYGVPKETRIVLERTVRVAMRDGVRLAANVFRPEAAGRYPVIICFAPYNKDRFPTPIYEALPNTGVLRVSEWSVFEAPDPVYWVPHGYIVVVADCRGICLSDKVRFEHFSPQIGRDFYDLVEWAAVQPWSSGNVASQGVSYLCVTQWLGAAQNPPHLKAFVPWEGFNDPYREHAFHGGIPDTRFFRELWTRFLDPKSGRTQAGDDIEDIVAEQKRHPLLDAYWRAKHPDLSRITAPAYIGASWSDQGLHTRGTIEGYKQIASGQKWLEVHGRKKWEYYFSREAMERQRRFLDHFLKGEPTGIDALPRVRVEVRERFYEGTFRFADDFPIPGTQYRKLYLDAAKGSLQRRPSRQAHSVRYRATASSAETDKADFSIVFDSRTELVGHMKLRLWVSADGADDMDLHVAIRKFDRQGNEVFFPDMDAGGTEQGLAAVGWLRVSHRELDLQRSRPWQPWLRHEHLLELAADERVPVEIEILPSGTAFGSGERLTLSVQGYDHIDAHNRFLHQETVNRGYHFLHTGGQYDSHLLVPVIPRTAWREPP